MNAVPPSEVVSSLIHSGAKKAKLGSRDLWVRGFLSGALLGFATVLAFTVTSQTNLPFLGALAFPVSFVMIMLLGLELVTGNFATIPMAVWDRQTNAQAMLKNWTIVFAANLVGSVSFGAMFWIATTKLGHTGDSPLIRLVISIAESKTLAYRELGWMGMVVVFTKGVLCNWMVTLGVVMAFTSTATIGKIAAIWLPIFTFFALGLEHCVVNTFIIPMAMMLGAPITWWDWWIWNQIPSTLGNILGGAVFTGFALYTTYSKSTREPVQYTSVSQENT